MPNLINEALSSEYAELFEAEIDTLVLQPVGLTVEAANAFRGKLSEAGLRMLVVKGSLARRALQERGLTGVDDFFLGPAACVFPEQDVEGVAITASRVVAAWRKETGQPLPAVKGGVLDGEVLAAEQAANLAKLPTKADLQATLSGQLSGLGARLSGQFAAAGSRIAGALKSRIETLEGQG